ncbi:hypothetical protein R1flu_010942 [Riccia fluitans]|uniref:Biopterin transport-related protein BT1 n=1 Tax=Riccia fluitans TaxID=41844 RepID=A0ABD1Z766_9MARC
MDSHLCVLSGASLATVFSKYASVRRSLRCGEEESEDGTPLQAIPLAPPELHNGGPPPSSFPAQVEYNGMHSAPKQIENDARELLDAKVGAEDQLDGGEGSFIKNTKYMHVTSSRIAKQFSWILTLCRELNVSFVFGIMVVYGVGQGVGGALNNVAVDFYWKDVQLEKPSNVQFYRGVSTIPWEVKPLWGLMTDVLPIGGYYRRPYFVITGLLSVFATMVLVLGGQLWVVFALGMLVVLSACGALSDATIDAEVAIKSREKPTLAADVQSFCAVSASVGSLVGYSVSGLAVDKLGPQGALGLMLIPSVLLLVLGFVLHEERAVQTWHDAQLGSQLWIVTLELWMTLKDPKVWRPTLYMYLALAVSPDISEGKFFWYTDMTNGPGFAKEFIGAIYATGSIGTLLAVYFYHKKLKRVSFRKLLFWVQVLIALFGMLDFVLVTRLNRQLGIPDHFFVVGDEGLTGAVNRLKWMPLLVLAAKLCPPGIEGTFFSLLMSVDNVGTMTSTWTGALLLKLTHVTRTDFTNLWLAVVIRNILRLVPLCFVFLLPDTDPDEDILEPSHKEEAIQLVDTQVQKENGLITNV